MGGIKRYDKAYETMVDQKEIRYLWFLLFLNFLGDLAHRFGSYLSG